MTDKLVGGVRQDMAGRGFALVATPPLVNDALCLKLKRDRTVLEYHSKQWVKFRPLARYGWWLECLLGRALPEESVSLASLEFRHETAGSVDEEVDRLHVDGSYIRSTCTLYGRATIYRCGRTELPVPDGQTLFITAMDRARALRVPCTQHRRPGAGPERAIIVCSFEPRREQPQRANTYRQVAQR
jgi:hypothetical protein